MRAEKLCCSQCCFPIFQVPFNRWYFRAVPLAPPPPPKPLDIETLPGHGEWNRWNCSSVFHLFLGLDRKQWVNQVHVFPNCLWLVLLLVLLAVYFSHHVLYINLSNSCDSTWWSSSQQIQMCCQLSVDFSGVKRLPKIRLSLWSSLLVIIRPVVIFGFHSKEWLGVHHLDGMVSPSISFASTQPI